MTEMICPRCGEPEFQRFGDHLRCDLCEFSLKDIGFSCPSCGRKTTTTFVVTDEGKYRICCARCALANRIGDGNRSYDRQGEGGMETLEDRIISEEEDNSLYQGIFILETVIPTKEPRFKKYRLSRDELEDFFEGHEEFAEFVVGLRRSNDV